MTSATLARTRAAPALSGWLEQLFDFGAQETRGERLQFGLLELFVLGYAVRFAWQWGQEIQTLAGMVVPQGIAQHVDISFMFQSPLPLINAAGITLCALCASFGRARRVAFTLLPVLLHLQYVARHSLGKTAHGSQFIGMALLLLAVAAWSMPTPSSARRFALGATRFFMGVGYVCAGICKLAATGSNWADGRHLWLWIGERGIDRLSDVGQHQLNVVQQLCLDQRWAATLFLSFGLATELLGFTLWFRRTRPFITLALIGLHLGVFAAMDLFFDTYVYQLAIVGLPLAGIVDRFIGRRALSPAR